MINNRVVLNLQIGCKNLSGLPDQNKFKLWVNRIFSFCNKKIEVTIRIVDLQEMHHLNMYYSGKNFPTNVLSFPFIPPVGIKSALLGDIVICRQIIECESMQNRVFDHAHWAHMIIHGSLHLLGYNHIFEMESILMRSVEVNMIRQLGYRTCCYLSNN